MNAIDMAKMAYSSNAAPIRTHRGTEYDAFSRCTRQLLAARTAPKQKFAEKVRAIHDNRRLWTVLAASVADANNDLPETLRGQIFYLAEFTQAQSRKILRDQASIDSLIEINMAVMRGLRGQSKASVR